MIIKIVVCFFVAVTAEEVVTQNTENNIHFIATPTSDLVSVSGIQTFSNVSVTTTPSPNKSSDVNEIVEIEEPNFIIKLYNSLKNSIKSFLANPKVITVLHNIGVCMVNGLMDIVTHFVPAPMIPLVASAAGFIIPFEPVVTLRRKMPVTSYRRAFNKAINSFVGTFDKYKDLDVEDPYMTRRFNRRFMNDSAETKRNQLKDSEE